MVGAQEKAHKNKNINPFLNSLNFPLNMELNELPQSTIFKLKKLSKLSEQLLCDGKHKIPTVKLSVQNYADCCYKKINVKANGESGISVGLTSSTCSLCKESLNKFKTGSNITVKVFNSYIKVQQWSLCESLGYLARECENIAIDVENQTPLQFCRQCYKSVEYLQNCYVELQKAIKEFHENVVRIRYFSKVVQKLHFQSKQLKDKQNAKEAGNNQNDLNQSENEETKDIKATLKIEADADDDQNSFFGASSDHIESDNDAAKNTLPNLEHNKQIIISKKQRQRSFTKTKRTVAKSTSRHGGLTEEEYQKKRRAQLRGYYLAKRKPQLIGPKPISAHSLKKLKRAEKLCLDSSNFPAKSNCGRKVPVTQLDESRFSYRNVQFSVLKPDANTTERYSCDKCCHKCTTLNVMKKHIAKSHFEPDHAYKCSLCDKTFYYRFQLRNHEARHTEKGMDVQCEECGISFKYKSGYFNHRRIIHWGIKPFECVTCGKKFGTKKDLRVHSLTHSDVKSHICQYCGDAFKTAKSLQTHEQKIHAK